MVMPTDTLYGIGCDAFDAEAVAALLAAKGRGRDMPVPVLVGSWHTIDGLVLSVSADMRALVESFWPGGLSIVVEQAPSLSWDSATPTTWSWSGCRCIRWPSSCFVRSVRWRCRAPTCPVSPGDNHRGSPRATG